ALQDMTNSALREGRLTQETVLAALTRHTDLSREDAQHVAGQLRQQWDESVVGPAVTTALRTLEMAGRTLWWVFGSLLIVLGAALGAGVPATSGRMKHHPEVAPARRLQEAPAPT